MSHLKADISLEVKRKTVPLYAMKSYGGVEVQLHSFLTSALDCSEWLTSRPGRFTPVPIEQEAGVGPRAGLDILGKREMSCRYRNSNPGPSIPQPSHCSN